MNTCINYNPFHISSVSYDTSSEQKVISVNGSTLLHYVHPKNKIIQPHNTINVDLYALYNSVFLFIKSEKTIYFLQLT